MGIELTGISKDKPYSMDANLMHISYEGGILEDPWNEPAKEMFLTTKDPGSGFVTPYPRTTPAGPGGGSQGCVDPQL